jgi:hypothetical protein
MDKRIIFSHHALARLEERGITQAEVISTVESGEKLGAKRGTIAFRKNFPFASEWKNRYYEIKQVMPIVMEKGDSFIIITAYAFYFGGIQ